jgi:hypothetical protein
VRRQVVARKLAPALFFWDFIVSHFGTDLSSWLGPGLSVRSARPVRFCNMEA